MITVKETAGDTLTGAIDGVNQTFITSFDVAEPIKVYLNGVLMVQDLETGWDFIPPRQIVMREAPLFEPDCPDTLEIEYKADTKTGGGALGGCPPAPQLVALDGGTIKTDQDIPDICPNNLEPTQKGVGENTPALISGNLKPTIIAPEGDC